MFSFEINKINLVTFFNKMMLKNFEPACKNGMRVEKANYSEKKVYLNKDILT